MKVEKGDVVERVLDQTVMKGEIEHTLKCPIC